MVHFCIMGGYEGFLASEGKLYVTLMGACELTCPTIARQVLARRRREVNGAADSPVHQFFLTLMGATEIKLATLAQEYVDLADLLRNRTITLNDWDRHAGETARSDVSIGSFTALGGFSDGELPEEDEEIESLALQRHLGTISEAAASVLQCGIGVRGAERRATIRRAIAAEELGLARS